MIERPLLSRILCPVVRLAAPFRLLRARVLQAAIARWIGRGDLRGGTILSAKLDAFGGRIGDILNGWRLAEALGSRFRFYWPLRAVPGILSADRVFDAEFLAEHLVETVDLRDQRPVAVVSPRDLRRLKAGGTLLLATKSDIPGYGRFAVATRGFKIPSLMSMAEAFERVPFRQELRAIRDWSREVPEFDVAVHVRRGDIFAGDYRLGGHFAVKAIPLPLVERVLAGLPTRGRVLLVGEDPERLLQRLRPGRGEVLTPAAFVPPNQGFPGADVFRDFCLLTRARRIVAGKSVFALIPARVAGIEPTAPHQIVDAAELDDLLLDFIRAAPGTPDLEVALACEYLRVRSPEATARVAPELVAAARRADPGNPVYPLWLAAASVRAGDRHAAAAILAEADRDGVPETLVRLLRNDLDITRGVGLSYIWGGFLSADDLQVLRSAANDIGWCAFLSALEYAAEGAFATAEVEVRSASGIAGHPAVRELLAILRDPPARVPSRRGGSLITPSVEEGVE